MKLIYQIALGVLLATGSISAYAGGIIMMGGGVSSEAAPPSYEIDDDFSTNTSADYTIITGYFGVSGGVAYCPQAWDGGIAYHETALSSVNHYAQASVTYSGSEDGAGLIVRSDGTNYYRVYFSGGEVKVRRNDNEWFDNTDDHDGSYATDTYTLKCEVETVGSTVVFKTYVGGILVSTSTDDTGGRYTTGSYIGLWFYRGNANYNATADNLIGDAL